MLVSCIDNESKEKENEANHIENLLERIPKIDDFEIGEYVLSPSKSNYDSLLSRGMDRVVFLSLIHI